MFLVNWLRRMRLPEKLSGRKARRPGHTWARCQPMVEPLEGRVVPATVNYTAATDLLAFTADAGEADAVAVTAPAATTLRIQVGNGDSITLSGDASGNAAFVLSSTSSANDTLTIDTAAAPVSNFSLDLGDQSDSLTLGLINPTVSINGGTGTNTATLNGGVVSETIGVSASQVTRSDGGPVSYSNLATLTVNGTGQADTINITGTAASTATIVNAGGGLDTFGAIDQTTIAALGLMIDGGGQGEALTINGGAIAETIGVSATQITRSSGGPVGYSGLASLTVNGTGQADTINITGTAAGTATIVNAGGGLDTFGAIDQTTIAAAGLTVNGGGQGESLTVNGGSVAETIGVSATQVTRSDGGPISYGGLAGLTVNATSQADTVNITGTAAGVSATVNAGGGGDTVRAGNASTGLGDLAGPLTVNGGGQAGDSLTLDDQNSPTGHTYGVSAVGVTRDGTSVLNFSGFASLTLNASDQADTINVASTASGLATTVNGDGGLDTFGAIDQTTIGAAGLTVNGGGQGETLTVNGGSVAETIGVSATQVTRSSGGPVGYSGLASLTVNGTAQADTINITGTAASTATTVNAGGGLDTFGAINQTMIGGALTVNGGGQGESLTLNGGSVAETIGVSATQVTRSDGGPINYGGFASLTVNGTGQGDTINITSTASGLATTVNALGGGDTVRVGDAATGLGNLAGPLTVDGGGQAGDSLTLDDQNAPAGHTYGVSAAGITRDGSSVLTFSGFASLMLNASDRADTISVASTASGVATTINGDGGLDTFGAIDQTTIGAAGLTINGGGQGETLTVNGGPVAETIGVNATQVTRSSGGPVGYGGMASLTVNGTSQADTINITSTASGTATIVNAGGGLDAFGAINQTTIGAAGLTVNGGGQGESLTLNGATSAETIGVSATQVTRSDGGPVSYSAFAALTVNATGQSDTINVTGTAAGVNTTVNGNGGSDADRVGNASNGLGGLAGALTVDGGGQAGDSLTLDDQNSPTGHTYGVSAVGVTRDGTSVLNFSTFANLALNASDQADTINVASTAAGLATTVNGDGGLDTFGAIDQTTIAAAGLTVNGGGQGETLTVNGGTTAETIGVSATQITRSSGGPVGYSGLANLTVNGSNQADTVNVIPGATTLFINGNDPTPPASPGDRLTLDLTGTTGATLTATPSATGFMGMWTFTNRQTVNFTTIETLTPAVSIVATDASAAETGALETANPGRFTLTRMGDTTSALTISYTVGGTAINGVDYTAISSSVMIPAGATSAFIDINVVNDSIREGAETFVITLTGVTGGVIGSPSSATVTIADNETGAVVPPSTPGRSVIVAGVAAGGFNGVVDVFDASSGQLRRTFQPYFNFGGSVAVAAADVTGDGIADIITGASINGHVKVIDGATGAELRSFLAFTNYGGSISVAGGDVNGDGFADLIVGADVNAAVKVFDGRTGVEIRSFIAYPGFSGAVRVAAADVDGDGRADILTGAGPGAPGGHVKVFSAATGMELRSFLAYDSAFLGGVFVAGMDLDNDGRAEIITGAGLGAGSHVRVFDGASGALRASFLALDPGPLFGATVAGLDINGNGRGQIVAGDGPGIDLMSSASRPRSEIRVFDGSSLAELNRFFAFGPSYFGGLFLGGR